MLHSGVRQTGLRRTRAERGFNSLQKGKRRREALRRVDSVLEGKIELILAALMPPNALICRIMLATGLRVGDVVSLKSEQVRRGRTTIHEQKTGNARRITIPAELREDILKRSQGSIWAFPSPRDPTRHRTRQAVWYDLKRASKAFRMREDIGCHSWRKTFSVRLMHKYGDIGRVQKVLGHRNAETTVLYALADHIASLDARPVSKRNARGRRVKGGR